MAKAMVRAVQAVFWVAMSLWMDKHPLPTMFGFIAGVEFARAALAFIVWSEERQSCP